MATYIISSGDNRTDILVQSAPNYGAAHVLARDERLNLTGRDARVQIECDGVPVATWLMQNGKMFRVSPGQEWFI